jgi:hypothetical protein
MIASRLASRLVGWRGMRDSNSRGVAPKHAQICVLVSGFGRRAWPGGRDIAGIRRTLLSGTGAAEPGCSPRAELAVPAPAGRPIADAKASLGERDLSGAVTTRVDARARVCVWQNYYSVPARCAGRRLPVRLSASSIEMLDGLRVVARH